MYRCKITNTDCSGCCECKTETHCSECGEHADELAGGLCYECFKDKLNNTDDIELLLDFTEKYPSQWEDFIIDKFNDEVK